MASDLGHLHPRGGAGIGNAGDVPCLLTQDHVQPATPINAASRWYAIHCQPHRESVAAAHLANQDFKIFLPRCEKVRRHARKIEKVRRSFFPGYLFIQLDVARERWRAINSTCGVNRIVMQNERPAPAPFGVVETLMRACDDQSVLRWKAEFALGQKVRVITGPLMELVGELDQLTDADRVRVLLDIMGGKTRVVIPRAYLMPEGSAA